MLPIIEQLSQKLAKFPSARFESDSSSITFFPNTDDGFIVRLVVEQTPVGAKYTVFYNGCHEEFTHWRTAMEIFGFGLSTGCRLREYSRYGKPYCWVVEVQHEDNIWRPDWETTAWTGPFWQIWCSPQVRLLQNCLIDLNSPPS
jgi:hypothetical protein